jgi:hypothetical protein
MDHIAQTRRRRGVNFVLGGTVAAAVILLLGFATGVVDLGLGVPEVRIDGPSAALLETSR